ncbi:MFS transporter [Paenibacillus endoradicis]|uniref:MFS transporter n=1 Tax=Paenibacillus endoradicis TaxID=2972487 RepID=UPI0021593C27|nr:MFS transporter [Paenibacillus endoradicis]MCR8656397.1 MFS transporter [Paenibacillus endoradicis]
MSAQHEQSMNQNRQNRAFGMRDKLGYMFGDFGNDFFFLLVSSFLMVYYTDIFHLNAAHVGILFLIARVWDAFADVAWGRFIDSRKSSKHGKFKPWILRMSFPLVLSGILMFIHIPGMGNTFYLVYAFVTYLLWGTLYSTVNIPYGSMASVITGDVMERTTLSTYRTMGSMLASLIITVGGPFIIFVDNQAVAGRFTLAAILFGILSIACYIGCYTLSTERITQVKNPEVKADFKKTLKSFLKNKPLLSMLVASLLFMMCTMLLSAVNVYLFKDYFNSAAKALSISGLMQVATVFIAIPISKPLVHRFGKKEVATVGMLLASIVYLILFFLPDISALQYIGIAAIGMFGYSFFNLVVWAFVTDVIDYHEYLMDMREDGTVYSVYSFSRKIGQAIAGGIGGFALTYVGYQSDAAVQSEEALKGIHNLATIVPSIIYFIIFLVMLSLYPLTKQRTKKLAEDLAERRKNKSIT